jgi:hypothetical protein
MGTQISIDKHVSNLDDILEMQSSYFEKIKFESKVSPDITQHLKVQSKLSIEDLDMEIHRRQTQV